MNQVTILPDPAPVDPMDLFLEWQATVADSAVCLSTVTDDGRPCSRMVLLRGADDRGFHFFSSERSPKGRHIRDNPAATMTWYWPPARQVRAEGDVERMDDAASSVLWSGRPRPAQLQVLAFEQSEPAASRAALLEALARVREDYEDVHPLPRPDHWRGYTLRPRCIQFWAQGADGVPDRYLYVRGTRGWAPQRLAP